MVFKELTILDIDCAQIEEAGSNNEVLVPYVLSDTPPVEWKQYFERHAPANATVVGNTVRYTCSNDKVALRKYGSCWQAVADLVDNANRHYLGLELQRWQESCRQAGQAIHKDEQSEFDGEWGRYMGRD